MNKKSVKPAQWADQAVAVSYKKARFARDNSPVHFRSYSTIPTGSGGSQKEFVTEHGVYVSEVWKTSSGSDDFPADAVKRSDRFYPAQ